MLEISLNTLSYNAFFSSENKNLTWEKTALTRGFLLYMGLVESQH